MARPAATYNEGDGNAQHDGVVIPHGHWLVRVVVGAQEIDEALGAAHGEGISWFLVRTGDGPR